jgi:AhpD family alkylhydroperoxidase
VEEEAVTQRLDYQKLSAAGLRAFGGVYVYIVNSGLPKALIDLVFLRASQINGCAYCIDMHSRDLLKGGASVEKVMLVSAWREAGDIFTAKERVWIHI